MVYSKDSWFVCVILFENFEFIFVMVCSFVLDFKKGTNINRIESCYTSILILKPSKDGVHEIKRLSRQGYQDRDPI